MKWYKKLRNGGSLPQHYRDFLDELGDEGEDILTEYLMEYHPQKVFLEKLTIHSACDIVWRDFE